VKYRDFIAILELYKFELDRHGATSHRQYVGIVGELRRIVTVSGRDGDDIRPDNLSSMKRQSGLPKKAFRH
jgi:predicted RNA binding protein YcfA (HicA-like mRNA interferase family)